MINRTSLQTTFGIGVWKLICVLSGFGGLTALAADAPTGFDNKTNGFIEQTAFDKDRKAFEDVETIMPENLCEETDKGCVPAKSKGGLGPVYNATSCVSCHQNPVAGSSSQILEIRAGHFGPDPDHPEKRAFVEHPGGSLVHHRAINATIQEHVLPEDTNRTFRISTNILGDGFVECIDDLQLIFMRDKQRDTMFGDMRGTIVLAPVATSVGTSQERVGRFGWKSQHASLLNFSADAYINEMGITSPLQPTENSSNGADVSKFDKVPDPEDKPDGHTFGEDVEAFTRFLRATKAPSRDDSGGSKPLDVEAGEKLFRDTATNGKKTGCAVCHTPDWTTLAAGTQLPGNFPDGKVPPSLGGKTIHPFSDFLLHDIGTGDGIVQTQHAQLPPRSSQKITPLALPQTIENPPLQLIHLLSEPIKLRSANNRQSLGGDLVDTAPMIRTAPLWGLRVRPNLLHDGSALTIDDAIRKHRAQAEKVRLNYENVLTDAERNQLLAFLSTL